MSINDFVILAGKHPEITLPVLLAPPVLALLWGLFHRRERSAQGPWKQGYAALVYLAALPGMAAAVLVAYSLFFLHANLLGLDLVIHFLPLATAAATLVLVRRRVAFGELPGVGRLGGFMALLALSFALALAIDRTRIFVGFFGSVDRLLLLVAGLFVFMKAMAWLAFGRRARD